jgi:hypothetical protein
MAALAFRAPVRALPEDEHTMQPFTLELRPGLKAAAAHVEQEEELELALRALGIADAPALVLVGGAGAMEASEIKRVETLFGDAIVPVAERHAAVVIDGGTDTGVMRAMGRARAARLATFPLVGVVVATLAAELLLEGGAEAAPLEPHHTHLVLVPGSSWGDEAAWLARIAAIVAAGRSSATVLVNGGDISMDDVRRSVADGRPVITVDGSGRAADELAAAARGEVSKPEVLQLVESGLVRAVDIGDARGLAALLEDLLAG